MKTLTIKNYEARLELAEMRYEDSTREIVPRLRYCFPELDLNALERMAERHPDVIRERQSCRRWAAYCRRRIRSLRAVRERSRR